MRTLPRTSSLEQPSSYEQTIQSMQTQSPQQTYGAHSQQIPQQYQQQTQQQFESPTRQRNPIKGPSHPPPNQSSVHNQIQQNYEQVIHFCQSID